MPRKNTPALLGRHNPRLARLRRLIQREDPALTVVDGIKLVEDLASRLTITELFTVEEHLDRLRAHPVLADVFDDGRAYLLDPRTMANLAPTQTPQGVLAVVPAPANEVTATGVAVYLNRVQDPGNVGSVIRCAAAFAATGVACSQGCADPYSPRTVRASAGQSLLLLVQVDAPFEPLAAAFRNAGGQVVGTTGAGGTPLPEWRPRAPIMLVLGNEGQGLADEVAAGCTEMVTVPLAQSVDSLNVAVTAGVILASLAGVAGSPILERRSLKGRRR